MTAPTHALDLRTGSTAGPPGAGTAAPGAGDSRGAARSITSTALNRRILSMEQELGVAIFERLPRGVRLSTAGEILIQHVRSQISDTISHRGAQAR